jgi:hypothetical protein
MSKELEKYKILLDNGSFEGLRYVNQTKSRFESMRFCLDFLEKINEPRVLELGTTRSFVDGKFEGCNSDDPSYWNLEDFSRWDWGAGCFTLIFGLLSKSKLTTVDLMFDHLRRCKIMTDSLGISCEHVAMDSVNYLSSVNEKFDLIYLDTGDVWPIDYSSDLQLNESKVIVERNLLKEGGLILIDDVLNGAPRENGDLSNRLGKSEKSIPFLLDQGFKLVFEGYQYILSK